MVLVTGATGKLGRLAVEALLKRIPASQVIAGVRSPEKAADLAARGVTVRALDYDRPETLATALAGVDKVLLISASEIGKRTAQHTAVIAAAAAAGVQQIAYTSILHADTNPMSLAREHQATEAAIRGSGIPFVFLRNSWYTENYTDYVAPVLQSGVLIGAAGQGRVSTATRADYAEAAAIVLTSDGHLGKIYELAGDASVTLTDIATIITEASGKPVRYQDLPEAELSKTMQSFGYPAVVADTLANADAAIATGALDDTHGQLSQLLGRPATPVAEGITRAIHT